MLNNDFKITRWAKSHDGTQGFVEGYAIRFTDETEKDLTNEFFTEESDLQLDNYGGQIPTYYHHGQDGDAKPIGKVISLTKDAMGVFVKVAIDLTKRTGKKVWDKLNKGEFLGFSSGSIAHLVKVRKDGFIERWPFAELSITPTPAARNLTAIARAKASQARREQRHSKRDNVRAAWKAYAIIVRAALNQGYSDYAVKSTVTPLFFRALEQQGFYASTARKEEVLTEEGQKVLQVLQETALDEATIMSVLKQYLATREGEMMALDEVPDIDPNDIADEVIDEELAEPTDPMLGNSAGRADGMVEDDPFKGYAHVW